MTDYPLYQCIDKEGRWMCDEEILDEEQLKSFFLPYVANSNF